MGRPPDPSGRTHRHRERDLPPRGRALGAAGPSEGPTRPGGKEFEWLPRLAPLLPVEIPIPVGQGRPTADYPWYWEVHTWVHGDTAPVERIDATRAVRDLAGLVGVLQQVSPKGAPRGRGIALAERDEETRSWLERFDGDQRVTAAWERALSATPWGRPARLASRRPGWAELDRPRRADERGDRLGLDGVGDPACDVMVAWKLHSAEARDAFRRALPIDDATWERARGWVLSQSVAALAYYTPKSAPVLYAEAQSWLQLVLSETA